jgi:hypothetical protein
MPIEDLRSLLSRAIAFVAAIAIVLSAQIVNAQPIDAQWANDVALPSAQPTLAGTLLSWIAVAALSLVTILMGLAGVAMARRGKDSKIWATVNSLWVIAQTVVAHVERELRPKIQKALEDGKLSAEEGAFLKAEALRLFKEAAGSNLLGLQKLLGLTEGAVGTFISGLIERAVSAMKATSPTPGAPAIASPSETPAKPSNP